MSHQIFSSELWKNWFAMSQVTPHEPTVEMVQYMWKLKLWMWVWENGVGRVWSWEWNRGVRTSRPGSHEADLRDRVFSYPRTYRGTTLDKSLLPGPLVVYSLTSWTSGSFQINKRFSVQLFSQYPGKNNINIDYFTLIQHSSAKTSRYVLISLYKVP